MSISLLGRPLDYSADVLRESGFDQHARTQSDPPRVVARRGSLIVQASGDPVHAIEAMGPPDARFAVTVKAMALLAAGDARRAREITSWIRRELKITADEASASRRYPASGVKARGEAGGLAVTVSMIGRDLAVTISERGASVDDSRT